MLDAQFWVLAILRYLNYNQALNNINILFVNNSGKVDVFGITHCLIIQIKYTERNQSFNGLHCHLLN